MECACYASYFVEFADYYERERDRGDRNAEVCCISRFRPFCGPRFQTGWFSGIFELKAMSLNGEYTERPAGEPANRLCTPGNMLFSPLWKNCIPFCSPTKCLKNSGGVSRITRNAT